MLVFLVKGRQQPLPIHTAVAINAGVCITNTVHAQSNINCNLFNIQFWLFK